MNLSDGIRALERDITELRRALRGNTGLSADARVAGLSALVHAEAVILAVETYGGPARGVAHDVVKPLTKAMGALQGAADKLTEALQRLPKR